MKDNDEIIKKIYKKAEEGRYYVRMKSYLLNHLINEMLENFKDNETLQKIKNDLDNSAGYFYFSINQSKEVREVLKQDTLAAKYHNLWFKTDFNTKDYNDIFCVCLAIYEYLEDKNNQSRIKLYELRKELDKYYDNQGSKDELIKVFLEYFNICDFSLFNNDGSLNDEIIIKCNDCEQYIKIIEQNLENKENELKESIKYKLQNRFKEIKNINYDHIITDLSLINRMLDDDTWLNDSIYKLLVLEDKNQLIKISNYISRLDTELKIQTLQRLELEYLLNSTIEGAARLEETWKEIEDTDFDFDVDLLINALEQQKNIARGNIFYYEILDRQQKLLNEAISKKRFKPKTKNELRELINDDRISLANIDTSLITDMSSLFEGSERIDFDGIENWDTSNVINMKSMFAGCKYFNKKLNWDTSKVVDMESMFLGCKRLNKLIEFDISNVLVSDGIFYACKRLKPTNIRLKIKN